MITRMTSDKERQSLKLSTMSAISALGGKAAVVSAGLTRGSAPTLSRYSTVQDEDIFTPVDVALDLDRACGDPLHARALARAQGFALVPLATRDCEPGIPTIPDVLAIMREARDVEETVLASIGDGQLPLSQKRDIKRALTELRTVMDQIERKVDEA